MLLLHTSRGDVQPLAVLACAYQQTHPAEKCLFLSHSDLRPTIAPILQEVGCLFDRHVRLSFELFALVVSVVQCVPATSSAGFGLLQTDCSCKDDVQDDGDTVYRTETHPNAVQKWLGHWK